MNPQKKRDEYVLADMRELSRGQFYSQEILFCVRPLGPLLPRRCYDSW